MELPKLAALSDTFQVKLTSADTFGKFVGGKAVVTFWKTVRILNRQSNQYENERSDLLVKTVTIKSAAETFDVDLNDLKVYSEGDINVDVKFTESSTRVDFETSAILKVVTSLYELIITGSEVIVQNQLYYFTVFLRRKDTKTPVSSAFLV